MHVDYAHIKTAREVLAYSELLSHNDKEQPASAPVS
jgi:hypothetical protein